MFSHFPRTSLTKKATLNNMLVSDVTRLNASGMLSFESSEFNLSLLRYHKALDSIKKLRRQNNEDWKDMISACVLDRVNSSFSHKNIFQPLAIDNALMELDRNDWCWIATLTVMNNAALVHYTMGQLTSAEEMLKLAVSMIERRTKQCDFDAMLEKQKAVSVVVVSIYLSLARVLFHRRATKSNAKLRKIMVTFHLATKLGRRFLGKHPIVAGAYTFMGHMLLHQARMEDAMTAFEIASQIYSFPFDQPPIIGVAGLDQTHAAAA